MKWNRKIFAVSVVYAVLFIAVALSSCKEEERQNKEIVYTDSIYIDGKLLKFAEIDMHIGYVGYDPIFIFDDYMMVWQGHYFYAFYLNSLERIEKLEEKLNKGDIERPFVYDSQLYGYMDGIVLHYFDMEKKRWKIAEAELPFFNQAPMYEDDRYACYSISHGEFGGVVFFYNKATGRKTFVIATVPTGVSKVRDRYHVVAHLGHMCGFSSLTEFSDPDSLFVLPDSVYTKECMDNIMNYRRVVKSYVEEKGLLDADDDDEIYPERFMHHFGIKTLYDEINRENYLGDEIVIGDKTYFLRRVSKDSSGIQRFNGDSLSYPVVSPDLPLRFDGYGESRQCNNMTLINLYKGYENMLCSYLLSDSTLIKINWDGVEIP